MAPTNKVIILGSAQDGGLPQLGAIHPLDKRAINEPNFRRTAASIAVVSSDGHSLLIDASPDLRYQHFQTLLSQSEYQNYHNENNRSQPLFNGIVLTHAHIGHYAGLVHFGKEAANSSGIPTYVTPSMATFLQSHAPWKQLITIKNLNLEEVTPKPYNEATPITVWDGLQIKLFTVPHRAEFTGLFLLSKLLFHLVPNFEHQILLAFQSMTSYCTSLI